MSAAVIALAAAGFVWAVLLGGIVGALGWHYHHEKQTTDDAEWLPGWLDEDTETWNSDTPLYDAVALEQLRQGLAAWGHDDEGVA